MFINELTKRKAQPHTLPETQSPNPVNQPSALPPKKREPSQNPAESLPRKTVYFINCSVFVCDTINNR